MTRPRLSGIASAALLLLAGCSIPLPGNDFHEDAGVQDFYIAMPCDLKDRTDISALPIGSDWEWNVVLVCDPSEYPPLIAGRSPVLFYVDYTNDEARLGLREQTIATLDAGGNAEEFTVFELFCADAIEFGGWQEWPGQGLDPQRLKVQC